MSVEANRLQEKEDVAQAEPGRGAHGDTTVPEPANAAPVIDEQETVSQSSSTITPSPEAKDNKEKISPNPESTRTKWQTTIIMASLMASVFLAALDITIVTTALPTISEHFHSDAGYTWVGAAYLLANSASTPSWGKFSDIWGRKPIILIAAAIFFLGSLIAGLSINIGMLITARAIQGIGGGGLIIMANICIGDLFSIANRGLYYGLIGMVWAFSSAIGPIVGGAFTEKVTWRWCFYINLPITGCVWVLLFFYLKLDNPKTPVWAGLKAVDWLGSLSIVGGTLMLLLGLEFGGVTYPWKSAKVICLIVFGIVVGVLFVLNEWKLARYPVMPLRLFKNYSNVAALGVCFCHGYVFIAGSYYLPLYFQAVLGATPLLSGVYQLPFALSLSLMSASTGFFIKATGKFLPPIYFGLIMLNIGFGLFINLPAGHTWSKIIIYEIIAGLGVGPLFQAPLIALQSRVAPQDIATATATFGFIRNISTAISVVIGSVVFQNQLSQKASELTTALGPQIAAQLSGGSAGANVGVIQALPTAQRKIAQAAWLASLKDMWIMYVAFAALGLLISMGIGTKVLSKEHSTVKTGLAAEEANRKERKEEKRKSKMAAGNGNANAEKVKEEV